MQDWIDALSANGANDGYSGTGSRGAAHLNLGIRCLFLQCLRDYLANGLRRMSCDFDAPGVGYEI